MPRIRAKKGPKKAPRDSRKLLNPTRPVPVIYESYSFDTHPFTEDRTGSGRQRHIADDDDMLRQPDAPGRFYSPN